MQDVFGTSMGIQDRSTIDSFGSTVGSLLDSLSESQQERIAEIVEGFLGAMERGELVTVDSIVEANLDLEHPLRACLKSLESIHDVVRVNFPSPTMSPSFGIPQVLGDFELISEIGRGGMGIVYEAEQRSLDRRVALKMLPSHHFLDPKQVKRFTIEAQAAAQLHHRSIVPVYAVGQDRGTHYYVMQLIRGSSFDRVPLTTWHQNRFATLIDAFIHIADALQHAHECGVIHRDIKPSNLLREANNHVWITDFGLASRTIDQSITRTGELIGTTHYMSPEQALGKPVDERADIYSLGATLYELATGHQAQRGSTQREVLDAIEHRSPILPRKLNAKIPVDLETVILKAMAKDREHRYASAAELASDLACVRENKPISGRRPPVTAQVKRWLHRHRTATGIALTGSALLAITFVVATLQVWTAHTRLNIALADSNDHLVRAQNSYLQSRQLLDRWNNDLVPELLKIPGAERISSHVLEDTIDFYCAYLDGVKDQPLDTEILEAKTQLANAYSQVGLSAKAIDVYRSALNHDAIDLASRSSDAQRLCTLMKNNLGMLFVEHSDPQAAIELLRDVVASYEIALAKNGDNGEAFIGLATAQLNLAKAYQLSGEADQQLSSIDRALLSLSRAKRLGVSAPDLQSKLAVALDHQAAAIASQDPVQALKASRQALGLHRACLKESPADYVLSKQYSASLHNAAVLASGQGQNDEASRLFVEAIAKRSQLVNRLPLVNAPKLDLAHSRHAFALLLCQQRDWVSAIEAFDGAISGLTFVADSDLGDLKVESTMLLAEAMLNRIKVQLEHGSKESANELVSQLEGVNGLLDAIDVSSNSQHQDWLASAKADVRSLLVRSQKLATAPSRNVATTPEGTGV